MGVASASGLGVGVGVAVAVGVGVGLASPFTPAGVSVGSGFASSALLVVSSDVSSEDSASVTLSKSGGRGTNNAGIIASTAC